ncbi:MAG: diacylglycerol kinase family lipid kinase [Ignavibacteriales bacterium]
MQNIRLAFPEDFNITFKVTQTQKDAILFAQNSVIENSDYIIAVGGDGTLHEVINGIMNSPLNRRKHIIAGILPTGSGNDFARTLKIKSDINSLIKSLTNNEHILVDIGKISLNNSDGAKTIKYFINIAEIGLGAEVVKIVNSGSKKLNPTLNFFVASIKSFLTYKKKKIRVTSENFNYEGNVLVMCFANGKYFGSGLQIAPHAIVNDGKLAVFLAGNVGLLDYLKNLSKIRKGSLINHPNIHYAELSSCLVEKVDDGLLIEADGELLGKLPAYFEILKSELKFLV